MTTIQDLNNIVSSNILKDDINSNINILNTYEFNLSNDEDLHLVYYYLSIKSLVFEYDYMTLMKKLKTYNDNTKAIYYILKYRVFLLKHHLQKLKKLNVTNQIINLYTQYYINLSYLNLYDFDTFKDRIIELYTNINTDNDNLNLKTKLKHMIFRDYITYLMDDIVECDKPKDYFSELYFKIRKSYLSNHIEKLTNYINEFKNRYNFPKFVDFYLKYINFTLAENKTKDDILNYCEIIDYSSFGEQYQIFKYCCILIVSINKVRLLKNYDLYQELTNILISKSNIKAKFCLKNSIEAVENAYKTDIIKDRTLIKTYIENKLSCKEDVDVFELHDYIVSNLKDPYKVLEIFETYKNYLFFYIFSTNRNKFKIGLISILLDTIVRTNSYNYMDQVNIILKYYETNEKTIIFTEGESKILLFLKEKTENINAIFELIKEFDFEIIKTENKTNNSFLADNNNEKICIICLEEINNNIKMVKCNKCLRYISHINCLIPWLFNQHKCPYCNK